MRLVFLLLVLANVAFLAWSRHVAPVNAVSPAPTLARQIEPEKLKIVPPADPNAPAPRPAAAAPKPAPAPLAPAAACLEWGSFTLADYPRAEKALESLGLSGRLAQRRTEETAAWWVFIPPQGSRQGALKKAAELKALGVEDYFIVAEETDSRWALSLGVFRTEEAAQARLAALRGQGVRSAQMARRETIVPKVWLQVSGVDAALEAQLKDIAGQVEGSELRGCP
jgi:hypothetical protein